MTSNIEMAFFPLSGFRCAIMEQCNEGLGSRTSSISVWGVWGVGCGVCGGLGQPRPSNPFIHYSSTWLGVEVHRRQQDELEDCGEKEDE
jgi:hypothetical protein